MRFLLFFTHFQRMRFFFFHFRGFAPINLPHQRSGKMEGLELVRADFHFLGFAPMNIPRKQNSMSEVVE